MQVQTFDDQRWLEVARRNSRSVQTTVGWIFWDPGAVERTTALGLPGPLGYIAARGAPLAPAGPDALAAAFGSISPTGIAIACELVGSTTSFEACWAARDQAVVEGLREHAPAIVGPLVELRDEMWRVVHELPTVGRVLFAAHLRMPRSEDPLLDGWHAINCVREWRGDTHWAIVAAQGLTGVEASILHNEWLGYDTDWLARSRGSGDDEIAAGWASLRAKGLADRDSATAEGIALRQHIEDETDRVGSLPWRLLGPERAEWFPAAFEGPCEQLLARVDLTAGTNYQPASRIHPHLPD